MHVPSFVRYVVEESRQSVVIESLIWFLMDPAFVRLIQVYQDRFERIANKPVKRNYYVLVTDGIPLSYYDGPNEVVEYIRDYLTFAIPNLSLQAYFDKHTRQITINSDQFGNNPSLVGFLSEGWDLSRFLRVTPFLTTRANAAYPQIVMNLIPLSTDSQALFNLPLMMIYSDFVRFQLVGNTQIPLLASVPVSEKRVEFVTWKSLHQIYVLVGKNFVDVATIDVMDMFGKEFPFAEDATLVLTLGFSSKDRVYIRPENAVSLSNCHEGALYTDISERQEQEDFPT